MVAPLVIAAGIQAAGSLLGGFMQSSAANKAADAQATAAQNSLHAQQRATQQAQQLYQPGVAAYQLGLNALTERLGLPTQSVAQPTVRGGQFNPAEYLDANPDVLAEYQRLSPNNLKNNLGVSTPEQFAQWHYNQYGQYENRPGSPSQVVEAAPVQTEAPATANALTGSGAGVFGNTTDPTWTPPAEFSFSIDSFKDNPAYKFALEQGSGQVMANSAATGALQSGAALKALQDRGQKTAYDFYAPERDFAYGKYSDDWNRSRSTYESDRNYLTNRYDRATDDLVRYSSIGQNALTSSANAAMGLGATEADTLTNIGASTAANALTQGNIWGGVVNDLAGAAAGYYGGSNGVLKSKNRRA